MRRSAGNVRIEHALERIRYVVSRGAVSDTVRDGASPAEPPAHKEVESFHLRFSLLEEDPLEPDVSDPVLAAGVGASGHVELERLVEAQQPLLQILRETDAEQLGFGDRELAVLGSGARERAPLKG